MFANLRKLTDPAELGPFMDSNLAGSPATICRRIDQLANLGFNYFMASCATPGTPLDLRPTNDDPLRRRDLSTLFAGHAPEASRLTSLV